MKFWRAFNLLQLLLLYVVLYGAQGSDASKTVIDALSSDKRFSKLLLALQHTGLIRYINGLESCTFLAPVNDAFDENVPNLKDILLYHILDKQLKAKDLEDGLVVETKYIKEGYMGNDKKGQMAKVARHDRNDKRGKIAIAGAEIIDRDWKEADNGIIQVVDRFMTPPIDIALTLARYSQVGTFTKLIRDTELNLKLASRHPFTVFAATDGGFSRLNNVEISYLTKKQGREDLRLLLEYHIHDGLVYTAKLPDGKSKITTLEGEDLHVEVRKDHHIVVDDSGEVVDRDLIAMNGVIHSVDELLLPNALVFTPRKYLIGLNATRLVSLLEEARLEHYIDDPKASYTILAPRDEVFNDHDIPHEKEALAKLLKYHVIEGRLKPDDLSDGMLVKTELATDELKGSRQRARVSVDTHDGVKDIRFNQAAVVGEPVKIGSTTIYVISQVLTPPDNLVQTLSTDLRLSTFVAALYTSQIQKEVAKARGVSLFVPTNEAFKKLGLVTEYLFLHDSRDELQKVVRYHLADSVAYNESIPQGTTELDTYADQKLVLERHGNDIWVGGSPDDGGARIVEGDVLVASGVMHLLDQAQIPPNVRLTLHSILQGAKANTLLDAFKLANLTSFLTNTSEPYTLLAPSDKAFSRVNLTSLFDNRDYLTRVLLLHLIPGTISELKDKDEHSTLLSDDVHVVIREVAEDEFVVSVKGSRESHRAHVINHGRADRGGMVYEIDRVLLPEDFQHGGWSPWVIALVVILSIGLLAVVAGFGWKFWQRRRQGYEPLA